MTYEEKWKADGHSMRNRGCPFDYGYEEQPKFSRHCRRISCDDCWKREMETVCVDGTTEAVNVENLCNGVITSKNTAQIGDTIKCHDREELVRVTAELLKQGIYTDFILEKNGLEGFWLVVERVEE